MIHLRILITLLLTITGLAEAHGPCYRVFSHTPIRERIFLPKSLVQEQCTVADLSMAPILGDTNLLARLFADPSKERAGLFGESCASEVPLDRLTLQCVGDLLNKRHITELLSCTEIVPREFLA